MHTLTVRGLDDEAYQGLKATAAQHGRSMEAEARDLLAEGIRRRRRWSGATLADLSGDAVLSQIDTPYLRSNDPPREVDL